MMPSVLPGHSHPPAQPSVPLPSGGLTSDAQAREAIAAFRDVLVAAGLMEPEGN